MFNKIDKSLLDKITIQSKFNTFETVIIKSSDYENTYQYLTNNYGENQFLELPIISSFAIKTTMGNILKIANQKSVIFVSNNMSVCSFIYDSKKVIECDELDNFTVSNIRHSCVVIDTGIYPHIDFVLGKNRIIKFVDLINEQNIPYDDNGHGTFVSGVLGGCSIVDKYSGIDSKCNIIVIKALDGDGETNTLTVLKAMQWVLDNKSKYNIKVVCMSFGSIVSSGVDPLIDGAETLWNNGIVVVSAAGNSGPSKSTIMSPAASRKIITVGAVEKDKKTGKYMVAGFSSRGPIRNTFKPDIVVPGVDIISTNIFSSSDKNFYTKMTGTSVSTPMVAGVASLLYSINPRYTPDQIKYMLINSCERIEGDRNKEGFGILKLSKLKLIKKLHCVLGQCNFL